MRQREWVEGKIIGCSYRGRQFPQRFQSAQLLPVLSSPMSLDCLLWKTKRGAPGNMAVVVVQRPFRWGSHTLETLLLWNHTSTFRGLWSRKVLWLNRNHIFSVRTPFDNKEVTLARAQEALWPQRCRLCGQKGKTPGRCSADLQTELGLQTSQTWVWSWVVSLTVPDSSVVHKPWSMRAARAADEAQDARRVATSEQISFSFWDQRQGVLCSRLWSACFFGNVRAKLFSVSANIIRATNSGRSKSSANLRANG